MHWKAQEARKKRVAPDNCDARSMVQQLFFALGDRGGQPHVSRARKKGDFLLAKPQTIP